MKDWKDILWEKIKDLPYPEWIEKLNKNNGIKKIPNKIIKRCNGNAKT